MQMDGTTVETAVIMIITLGGYSNPVRKRKAQAKQRKEKGKNGRCKNYNKRKTELEQFKRGELFGRKETNDMNSFWGKDS